MNKEYEYSFKVKSIKILNCNDEVDEVYKKLLIITKLMSSKNLFRG